jgi:hypothetical protein
MISVPAYRNTYQGREKAERQETGEKEKRLEAAIQGPLHKSEDIAV